jgi:hypothetical protein
MKTSSRLNTERCRLLFPLLACVMVVLLGASTVWAIFGEDEEKPKPEFAREGEQVTAKLIPRGKRTSIQIDFAVAGGRLQSVEAMDFAEAERREVDKKDFRSGLFVVKTGGFSPGGQVQVSMSSSYFTRSTEFWVFNPKAATPWAAVEAEYVDLPERVEELRMSVRDGGPLDSDGAVNGEIVLICGPLDAFWGYAIGTLVIRFFGVFLVLAMLQIGMNVASRIFRTIEKRMARAKAEAAALRAAAAPPPEPQAGPQPVDAGTAAAIAAAIELHLSARRQGEVLQLERLEVPAWTLHGRERIMGERFLVFDRSHRSESTRLSR